MVALELPKKSHALVSIANVLLPGLYAWVTTVAYPASHRGAPWPARAAALSALVLLALGPVVAFNRPALGRAVGMLGFVALCLLTWIFLGSLLNVDRLEPVRAGLGGIGWALFGLGWGTQRRVGTIPEDDPHAIFGPPLAARDRLPFGALIVFGASLVGAGVVLFLAWRVTRAEDALLAQCVALIAAIALVGSGARVALDRGKWKPLAPRARINAAARPLALAALLLALGFVWILLR
jgi:hypothetical protein